MSTIYDRIRARRLELGLTVEDLAQQLGYKDKSSISKIENGKADIPQAKVELFANALHTTTAYLMGVGGPSLPPGCEPLPRLKRLPLVGRIACGMPILAEQNIEGEVAVPEAWHADFILPGRQHGPADHGRRPGSRAQPARGGERGDRGGAHW